MGAVSENTAFWDIKKSYLLTVDFNMFPISVTRESEFWKTQSSFSGSWHFIEKDKFLCGFSERAGQSSTWKMEVLEG